MQLKIKYEGREKELELFRWSSLVYNPAFRKSDISIGINSDERLQPVLDCKYMLDFNQLPLFLRSLMDNDLIFSEDLLPGYRAN
jgi:hypothetical protein